MISALVPKRIIIALILVFASQLLLPAIDPVRDWPAWRGPQGNGSAFPNQEIPQVWSETDNVLWKVPISGRGHSSPTIVGNRLYLTTADVGKQEQRIHCLDCQTGQEIWQTVVHTGNLNKGGNRRTSQASSSVSCDGNRLYINFLNKDAVYSSALDLDGKIIWQKKICDFETHQGFGSSPLIYNHLILISADHRSGGKMTALDAKTGKTVWSHSRPALANYTSPALLNAAGRDQVLLSGANLISSFEPLTGKLLWQITGSTTECVVTMVTDGERVFSGGGYPKNHTVAIEADGSGRIAWKNSSRVYVPSMLVKDDYLYAVMDAGFAVCWKSDTGKEMWKERLGGEFYASPVLMGNLIYSVNVRGRIFVFTTDPNEFKLIAENQLGDEVYSSPVICGNRFYLRVADMKNDRRQEYLYCIGRKSSAL